MTARRLTRLRVLVLGVVGGLTVLAACRAAPGDDDTDVAPIRQASRASNSIVALETGCTATKVGPMHLMLAASCVTNRPDYAIGRSVRFRRLLPNRAAHQQRSSAEPQSEAAAHDDGLTNDADDAALDVVVEAVDAGERDADDTQARSEATEELLEGQIGRIEIHPTFLARCGVGACGPDKTGITEAADVAVIVLTREVAEIPSAAVDMDTANTSDRVLTLSRGCRAEQNADAGDASTTARAAIEVRETHVAAADAVLHEGSPFTRDAALALAASYVITRGPGSESEPKALGVCSAEDIGAPLLRADDSAIVGVASRATFAPSSKAPVTNEHTRLDSRSKHQVAQWLAQIPGVRTTRSCGNTTKGCPPSLEAGADAPEGSDAEQTGALPLPEEPTREDTSERRAPEDSSAATRAPATSSCNASSSPNNAPRSAWSLIVLGALLRRRRRPQPRRCP